MYNLLFTSIYYFYLLQKKNIEHDFTICCHFADCILYIIQVHPPLSVCGRLIFSFVQSLREGAVRFAGVGGQGSI